MSWWNRKSKAGASPAIKRVKKTISNLNANILQFSKVITAAKSEVERLKKELKKLEGGIE